MRDPYHIRPETEEAMMNHIARLMEEHAATKYPYGYISGHDEFLSLLKAVLPELQTWACRNVNLDREMAKEITE